MSKTIVFYKNMTTKNEKLPVCKTWKVFKTGKFIKSSFPIKKCTVSTLAFLPFFKIWNNVGNKSKIRHSNVTINNKIEFLGRHIHNQIITINRSKTFPFKENHNQTFNCVFKIAILQDNHNQTFNSFFRICNITIRHSKPNTK